MRAPCVRVFPSRETRKSPLGVGVCVSRSRKRRTDDDDSGSGREREENFYVGPSRLVADVPKLEGLNLEGFSGKKSAAAITGSVSQCKIVPFPGNNPSRRNIRITVLVKTALPKSRINSCSVPSSRQLNLQHNPLTQ